MDHVEIDFFSEHFLVMLKYPHVKETEFALRCLNTNYYSPAKSCSGYTMNESTIPTETEEALTSVWHCVFSEALSSVSPAVLLTALPWHSCAEIQEEILKVSLTLRKQGDPYNCFQSTCPWGEKNAVLF